MINRVEAKARATRPVSWIGAARKAFEGFPEAAKAIFLNALTIAAEGGKSDLAKPMKGFGSGVLEIAVRYRSDAFRIVYALQVDADVWVVHAFKKKSTRGDKTRRQDVELIDDRLKRLREMLR